jgi:hypothetical protein
MCNMAFPQRKIARAESCYFEQKLNRVAEALYDGVRFHSLVKIVVAWPQSQIRGAINGARAGASAAHRQAAAAHSPVAPCGIFNNIKRVYIHTKHICSTSDQLGKVYSMLCFECVRAADCDATA